MINLIIVLVVVITAVWVYLDATKNKIGKVKNSKGMFNMSAGAWGTVTLFLWIIGFPAYLIKRSSLIEKAKESPVVVEGAGRTVKTAVLAIIGVLFIFVTVSPMLGTSKAVAMVKGGTLSLCPGHTVEQMANGFLDDPSWESGVGNNGTEFVNVSGGITLSGKPVTAVVQFTVDETGGTFQYNAFEINEVPQNNFMAAALFKKMCDSATN